MFPTISEPTGFATASKTSSSHAAHSTIPGTPVPAPLVTRPPPRLRPTPPQVPLPTTIDWNHQYPRHVQRPESRVPAYSLASTRLTPTTQTGRHLTCQVRTARRTRSIKPPDAFADGPTNDRHRRHAFRADARSVTCLGGRTHPKGSPEARRRNKPNVRLPTGS